MRRILITGGSGRIGRSLRHAWQGRYAIRVFDRRPSPTRPGEELFLGELGDLPRRQEIVNDVDALVHLAGDPEPAAGWPSVLRNNIEGTFSCFSACADAGVRQLVYASSIHALGAREPLGGANAPTSPYPASLYGASKAFGELLAAVVHQQRGLSVICLRLGSFTVRPLTSEQAMYWLSPRDAEQAFRLALESNISFGSYLVLSKNDAFCAELSAARVALGYEPVDAGGHHG